MTLNKNRLLLATLLCISAAQVYADTAHVIIGSYISNKSHTTEPFSFTTSDFGKTWNESVTPPTNSSTPSTTLYHTTCAKDGKHCVAVGNSDIHSDFLPVSFISDDSGETWRPGHMAPPGVGMFSYLSNVSCSSNGQLCVAVGKYDMQDRPLAYSTNDGGENWEISNIKAIPEMGNSSLSSVACSSDGLRCTAVGKYYNPKGSLDLPLSYTTSDGGKNWRLSQTLPPALAGTNSLLGVACDNSGLKCVAVGYYQKEYFLNLPLTYTSSDGGDNWEVSKKLPEPQSDQGNTVLSIACDANAQKCNAVGNSIHYRGRAVPLSYFTLDGGKSWSVSQEIPAVEAHFYSLRSIVCEVNGLDCITVGVAFNEPKPTVLVSYQSHDGGQTWKAATQSPKLRDDGFGQEISVA